MVHVERAKRIAALNDELRTHFRGGIVLMTDGVEASGERDRVIEAVRRYRFRGVDGNNPYGENDFGAVDVGGDKYFFKIDYYDLDLRMHSPDPTDPAVTRRVLTIMRANEY
jgi:hypothetical protein